jgi:hypothetical protein
MNCIYEQEQGGFTNSNFQLENIEADLINGEDEIPFCYKREGKN